jgi:hypothetical protein
VSWLLVAAGAVVALGAGVAVGARDVRTAVGGALVTLVISPFLADPLPTSPELAFSIVAGVLTAFLLLVAARRADGEAGSPLGLPAALAAAAAAFAAGLGATAVILPAFGPSAALAAGLACLGVATPPVVRASGPFRGGLALVILLEGGLLVRSGLVGTPSALEMLVAGAALAALAGSLVALVGAAAAASGDAVPVDAARPHLPVAADVARPRRAGD